MIYAGLSRPTVVARHCIPVRDLLAHPGCVRGSRALIRELTRRPGLGVELVERWRWGCVGVLVLACAGVALTAVLVAGAVMRDWGAVLDVSSECSHSHLV